MGVLNMCALVVDQSQDQAMDLLKALQPDIQFAASDFTVSLRKAALSHAEDNFEICFVSGSFSREDLASFIADMRTMKKDQTCLFVQVQESLAEGFDRKSAESEGFSTIISRKGTADDKEALNTALKNRFHIQEVKKRKVSVEEMMAMLLKEIDRTASDRRRGFEHKIVAIPMDGIELDTQFDPEVMESYFQTLEKQTETAQPRTVERLEVPEEVLKRALPGLSKEGYKGVSHRVWELLSQKYGVKIGQPPAKHSPETNRPSSPRNRDPSGANPSGTNDSSSES